MAFKLDDPNDLERMFDSIAEVREDHDWDIVGELFCPYCCQISKMSVEKRAFLNTVGQDLLILHTHKEHTKPTEKTPPTLLEYHCVNCKMTFVSILMIDNNGDPYLHVFPTKQISFGISNAPVAVAYFLEEAYKAQQAKAFTAAVGMYRAALEQILTSVGFSQDRLPKKIKALEGAITQNTAPSWAVRLGSENLKLMKEIADSQMHANDVCKLSGLNEDLMRDIQVLFMLLSQYIYAEPQRKAEAKDKLKKALKSQNTP